MEQNVTLCREVFSLRKVRIKFHGFLEKLVPNVEEGTFQTAYDLITFMCQKYPQLKAPLNIGRYAIRIEGYDTRESILCPLHSDTIDIYPASNFSKSAGMGQMIVATVLVVVAVIADLVSMGTSGGAFTFAASSFSSTLYTYGAILAITGLLTYLLTPKITNKGDNQTGDNKYLGSPKNTTANGTPIPIGYGKYKVYGHYLSFNINSSSLVIGKPNE